MLSKKSLSNLKQIIGKIAIDKSLSDSYMDEIGLSIVRFVLAKEASKIKGQE